MGSRLFIGGSIEVTQKNMWCRGKKTGWIDFSSWTGRRGAEIGGRYAEGRDVREGLMEEEI